MAKSSSYRRGLCFGVGITLASTLFMMNDANARQAYSTIQSNIREEAEIEPYEGGKKVGPIHDWALLCKIEGDETLKKQVIKSAEEGSLDHVFILACMNMHGKGIEKNQAAAFELFKAAANRGHSNSQNNLGFLYEDGIGVKKDLKQAFVWYKKAADYNNPSALCNLGNMYEHGKGIPVNMEEAEKLYQKSSELGNKVARQNMFGIEFERERNWKLKGIEVNQATASPSPLDKNGKKVAAKAPVATQPTTQLTYNPTNVLFKNEGKPAQETKAPTASAPPALLTAANTSAPAKPATPAAAPAKAGQKPLSPNESVLNALKAKSAPAAANNTASMIANVKAATEKTPIVEKPGAKTDPKAKVAEKAAATPVVEAKAEAKPDTFSAGTPTLTAILGRLSKGTSLEESIHGKKEEVVAAAPVTTTPAVAEPSREEVQAAAAKAQAEAKAAADAKASAEAKAKAEAKVAEAKAKADAKAAEEKAKADAKVAEEKAKATALAAAEKAKAEAKAALAKEKEKKVATEKPVTLLTSMADKAEDTKTGSKSPEEKPKAETKVASTSKPVVVATKPSATAGSGNVDKQFKALADKVNTSNRPIRDKWALVVGVTDFQDPDIPDLKYSAKDATDFYNYLVKEANFEPDHVRLLLNEQATQRRVLSELGSKFLARVVKPDDLVVLYFSTHGSPSQLDPRGKNYLVANDSDSDDLFATGIEMQKLLDSIQGRVLTDRVLLVLDACHSGFTDESKGMGRAGNFNTEDIAQGSGQLVICSSGKEERAWESSRYENGVFTKKLLDGLRSKGPKTTLVEAFTHARDAVGSEVQEDRPGAKQTPVLKGKWDGNDLVLATKAGSPQAVPTSVASNLNTDSRTDLVAMANKPQPKSESGEATKPVNDSAPRSGVLYLDSQFFSVNGDPRALAKEYHDAIRSNPSDPDLYYMRGKALIQMGDWHNALGTFSDAIQISPNRAPYYLGRAYVYFRLNKTVLAQEDLERAKFYDHKLSENVRFHM